MTCDPDLVACQISRLVDFAYSWDWNAFTSTLIATVIGAFVGLTAVWVGFRLQRKAHYRDQLEENVLSVEALIRDEVRRTSRRASVLWNLPYFLDADTRYAWTASRDDWPAFSALMLATTHARGQDRKVLAAGVRGLAAAQALRVPGHRRVALSLVALHLSRWVGSEPRTHKTGKEALKHLDEVVDKARGYRRDEDEEFGSRPSRARVFRVWVSRMR